MVEKTNEEVSNVLGKGIPASDSANQQYDSSHFQDSSNKQLNNHSKTTDQENIPSDSEERIKENINELFARAKILSIKESNLIPPGNEAGSKQNCKDHGCGIYYGIKSYLHQFYGPPDKEVLKSGEYVQGDDFRFLSEPHRRQNCWVRVGLWIGINLMLLGGIAILVGYFTPSRPTIVGKFHEFTILDRWAMNFNYHLMVCQLVGLVTFSVGAVVIICSLIVANCQPPPSPPAYLVMGAYLPPTTIEEQPHTSPTWGIHCIPMSGTLKSVQPNIFY